MIPIGVQTGGAEEIFGIDGAYRVIKEAGFDAVDVNLDHLLSYADISEGRHAPVFDCESEEEMLAYFRPWKVAAEKYGLDHYQAHAPFRTYVEGAGEYNDYLIEVLKKTIIGCDYIGCHCLVVHPFFNGYDEMMTPEREWQLNIASYAQLIPTAKKHHVTICLENMFTAYRGKIYSACCSDFDLACKYIDTLNDMAGEKIFGFCLDTGHALLLGKDIKQAMLCLGDRIQAFHVHDNDGRNDQHLAPYMGVLDWKRFQEGLREIGFHRTLSFETFNALQVFDPALAPDVLRLIAQTGRLFANKL